MLAVSYWHWLGLCLLLAGLVAIWRYRHPQWPTALGSRWQVEGGAAAVTARDKPDLPAGQEALVALAAAGRELADALWQAHGVALGLGAAGPERPAE